MRKRKRILRRNKLEMLQSKSTVTEINSAFDTIISRLNTTKGRISELEDMLIETFKAEKRGKERLKY